MNLRARLLALESARGARQGKALVPDGLGAFNEMLEVVGAIGEGGPLSAVQTLVLQMTTRLRDGRPSEGDLALEARLEIGRDALLTALESYLNLCELYPRPTDESAGGNVLS